MSNIPSINFNLAKKIAILLYIILIVVVAYHLYYAKKIIPGVVVGSVDVGGMTYFEAKKVLLEKEQSLDKTLSFEYNGQEFDFDASLFDLKYNIEATVIRAFEVGRTGNAIIDTKEKIAGLFKPLNIRLFYDLNENELSSVFLTIKGELNNIPQDAYYEIEGEEIKIVPSQAGRKVDGEDLYNSVTYNIEHFDFSRGQILIEPDAPEITEEHLSVYLNEVSKIVFDPIRMVYEEKAWGLTPQHLLSFIDVNVEDGNSELTLNKPAFEAYIELLAKEVNKLPRGKVTELRDNRVVGFEITQEGKELDIKQFTEEFKNALFSGEDEVTLAVNTISGLKDPSKYGIFALLGEGTSKYTGSDVSRALNLNLAAKRASGVLVPPGDIYSFNNSVGEISGATGYASAYIISNGRTVLGDGGGVCQTSTTLFRAVLNAGLPVVVRNPHAYRVFYYELESPVGFDASIYQPSLDFQFKNDSPNYVLVESFADKKNQLLGFRIYGTPDGREVKITEPVVRNISPPPEPLYQDDPELAKGITKQVDFAAWGATASFTRTVKDSDGVLMHNDTFTTNYQPWRAIYQVGTKEN